jgi:dimethylhistidine N-methyltransferase
VSAASSLARPRALETKPVGLIELWRDSRRRRFERDVLEGLSARPKAIPSQYLFDDTGTQLARAILETPEYYLARVEREILLRDARALVWPLAGSACDVIDLAPGDGLKTRILLERFRGGDVRYVPMASSDAALAESAEIGARTLPWLPMFPVRAEGFATISHISGFDPSRRRLVLLLGSQIGQLERPDAVTFLRGLRDALRTGDRLIVSFDLVKDPALLEHAYDDGAGLHARLARNVLSRINRELNGQFREDEFCYEARFCPQRQAVICQLVSRRAQSVRVGHFRHELAASEPIQTQLACKYRQSEIAEFARRASFTEENTVMHERSAMEIAVWSAGAAELMQ